MLLSRMRRLIGPAPRVHLHAQLFQLPLRSGRQSFRIHGQHTGRALEDRDPGLRRVDAAKVFRHSPARDFCDGPGEFDTGGPVADNREVQRRVSACQVSLALGCIEGSQDAAADLGCVATWYSSGWNVWWFLRSTSV